MRDTFEEATRRLVRERMAAEEAVIRDEVIRILRAQGYAVIPPQESPGGRGWFADVDPEEGVGEYVWQPCLSCDGTIQSFDIWFRSEADCLDFIHRDILGKGLLK